MPAQEILPNLYRMEIPLPNNPLRALNSYVIKDHDRFLVVDTGMNLPECRKAMHQGLKELEVDLNNTDFFLTHMHVDHSGLVGSLASSTSKIYCSQIDAADLRAFTQTEQPWNTMQSSARRNGLPQMEANGASERNPNYLFSPTSNLNFKAVKDGESLNFGDYHFQCMASPGHTRGHMCLYEPNQKLLISGDLILDEITPNITQWLDEGNYLKDYMESLVKISQMEINLVLPGHRSLIKNCRQRINELIKHHRHRLAEVVSILGTGSQNAYQVASHMTWDMTFKSWKQFPPAQKWFATGEALSHLRYLEKEGMIRKDIVDDKIVYSL